MEAQKFHFNLKNKTNPEKEVLVYILTSWKGKRIRLSAQQKITTKVWDDKTQRATISDQFSKSQNKRSKVLNKFLGELETNLVHEFFINENFLFKEGIYGTFEHVKWVVGKNIDKLLSGQKEEYNRLHILPFTFFHNVIEEMPKKINRATGAFINERTIIHHRTVLKRFEDFFKELNLNDDFSTFNSDFEKNFEVWAYTSKGYRSNTIPASFSVLKVWLNEAVKVGLMTDMSYKNYRSKGKEVDNIYLTEQEIEKLYRLDIPALMEKGEIDHKSNCEITRDLFIVGCWTGLRLSDLNNLNKGLFDIENRTITIITEKTKEKVVLPMHQYIQELYYKYNGRFPKMVDKSHSNEHLQNLGRIACIDEEIIFKDNVAGKIKTIIYKKYQQIKNHTARRSFATNMYLKGAPTISIMKLTGHTTEANFMKYIKISREENAELMRKYF